MSYSDLENGDRLWWDGVITVSSSDVESLLSKGIDPKYIAVSEITEDIEEFNKFSPSKIAKKVNAIEQEISWTLPEEYPQLDVARYVIDSFNSIVIKEKLLDSDKAVREQRINEELLIYENLGLYDFLRALIYVINTFQENNIIWGVGRGSGVASYVLYCIGVHDIDSVSYNLNIDEFLDI